MAAGITDVEVCNGPSALEQARAGRLRWAVNIATWAPCGEAEGAEFQFLLSLISSPEERKGVMQYVFWDDKKRALISRLLTRRASTTVLGLTSFDGVNISRTKGGKPFLSAPRPPASRHDLANFNFNVSHEGDWVVLASEPLCVCGIDVAAPPSRRKGQQPDIFETFAEYLTADEWRVVRAEAATDRENVEQPGYGAFQRFWSAKESFIKARGDGLAFEIGRAGFSFQPPIAGEGGTAGRVAVDGKSLPQWAFHQTAFGEDHWITVARGPTQDVVDEIGAFRQTFAKPTPSFGASAWQAELDRENPPFCEVSVGFLVPEEAIESFVRVGGTR